MPETQRGTVNVGNAQMAYEVAGEGQALIFLHAGICDMRMWDNEFDVFADSHRVVRYDQRGYGQSHPVEGTFSDIDDLQAVLDHLNIDQPILVGCSKGGTLAMDYTVLNPNRVKALVMVTSNPSGYEFKEDPPPIWNEMVKAWDAGEVEKVCEFEVQFWVAGMGREADAVPKAVRDKVYAMNLIALQNEKKELGEKQNPKVDAINKLNEIKIPFLAIVGDQDDSEIQDAGKVMASTIGNGQLVVMYNTAHLPNMEQPEAFEKHLRTFLDTL